MKTSSCSVNLRTTVEKRSIDGIVLLDKGGAGSSFKFADKAKFDRHVPKKAHRLGA
jgi:hypothetical protein